MDLRLDHHHCRMNGVSSKGTEPQPAAAHLGDDLLFEILARVPYKSLCRFQCVSKSWHALCSDPGVLKRSPRTLSGFFYRSATSLRQLHNPSSWPHHFTSVGGKGCPMVTLSLSFLPPYEDMEFIDSCNGLLLLQMISPDCKIDYVVCNPATEKWIVLPESDTQRTEGFQNMYLGFEPAVSPHFRVFLLVQTEPTHGFCSVTGLEIYSSETGGWTYRKSQWSSNTLVFPRPANAFFKGTLHLIALSHSMITVDMEGKTWSKIPTPHYFCFIGLSQGHMYAMERSCDNNSQLAIWALEDYGGYEQWVLKDIVSALKLFGMDHAEFYTVMAIHPECGLIFLNAGAHNLISYDMHSRKVHNICPLGRDSVSPYLPYIPCFSEWLVDGH